jgi:pantoate--beta-alanine ligase
MKVFYTIASIKDFLKSSEKTIGFVPTMGALHEGHLALIRESKTSCELTVCSVFVNPTQFNDPEDFNKYPITLNDDLNKLAERDCDVVFCPAVLEMYPNGLQQMKNYELGKLETILEGKFRPGHFQGVCQVVDLLLEIVAPTKLFMGEKDFQQIAVIRKMMATNHPQIELIPCPTIRSTDGLALSSRNTRLNEQQKLQALAIFKGFHLNDLEAFKGLLINNGFEKIDYIACVDPDSFEEKKPGQFHYVILVAAYIGGVRLIDNKIFR